MSKLLLVVALVVASALARADEPDAKSLFMRGRAAYALGHFTEAAELFEKAFELKQDPAILYNAAQAHRLAGDKKRALVLYQNYLRLFGERENGTEVEKRIADLKAAIDAEQAAKTNPPTDLLNDKGATPPTTNVAPSSADAPATPTVTTPPPSVAAAPADATLTAAPLAKKPQRRAWIWGVVVGSVVVVAGAVTLGVVLGTQPKGPAVTLGSVQAN